MSKGISIHIGLEYFNPAEYGGSSGKLPTCKKDTLDMEAIALSQNFEQTKVLLNEDATRENVVDALKEASELLTMGDMLFISYSGHGTYFEDQDGDEEADDDDGKHHDEAWCLYDGFLLDDELHYFWTLFDEGVRVFMISDSCHSGTMTKAIFDDRTPIEKSFSKEEAQTLYLKRKEYYDQILERASTAKSKEIKATVALISGCQDDESSHIFPPSENSLLTEAVNEEWAEGSFSGTVIEFFTQVRDNVTDKARRKKKYQTPKYYVIGKSAFKFEQEQPFEIEQKEQAFINQGDTMKKGISIHIGLENLDLESPYYGGAVSLPTCPQDAIDMKEIAESQNFSSSQLILDTDATAEGVTNAIVQASEVLVEGDILFISYSGHGTSLVDKDSDEEVDDSEGGSHDEAWCLYDRPFLDDELYALWKKFKKGVRIFIISDSCHSGTISKDIFDPTIVKFQPLSKEQQSLFLSKGFFSKIKEALSSEEERGLEATVKLIAGCQDYEESLVLSKTSRNSLLTAELLEVWDAGQFIGSTEEFFEEIKVRVVEKAQNVDRDQTPNLTTIGLENSLFDNQRPFSIYE